MKITDRVSKEDFDIASDNHQPNAWIVFAFKYFSKSTTKENFAVKKSVVGVLITLFMMGLLSTIFNLDNIAKVVTIGYSLILSALVLYLFSAVVANNYRISLIRKELGITRTEYDALVSCYY